MFSSRRSLLYDTGRENTAIVWSVGWILTGSSIYDFGFDASGKNFDRIIQKYPS
jgi:hypothetical protein